jgi:diguanylate cyclase (GGDEF)-like protein
MHELVGTEPEPGEAALDLFARVTDPDDIDVLRSRFSFDEPYSEGIVRLRGGGRTRYALLRTWAVAARPGRPARLCGLVVDVTDTHESPARVSEILEAISQAYFALDERWRFTYLNGVAESLLGRDRDQLLGVSIWDAFPDAVGTEFEVAYRRVLHDGVPVTFRAYYPPPLDGWFDVNAFPLGEGLCVYFDDVSERLRAEQERESLLRAERDARRSAEHARAELVRRASHDQLTGLPNREALNEHLDALLVGDGDGTPVTVLFIDLDRFKLINDSLGHAAGDELLTVIARRFRPVLRNHDVVARLGGDEFVVVLRGPSAIEAEGVAERLLEAVRRPVEVQGRKVVVTASIGICDAHAEPSAEALLRDADVALYRAKDAGRDQWARFDHRDRVAVLRRVRTEQDLRDALSKGQLFCEFQPEYRLVDGAVVGAEALLRWRHPAQGLVPPSRFVPIAEESGLIVAIGEWVLDAACEALADLGPPPGFTMWVNVAGRQLVRSGIVDYVRDLLRNHRLEPGQLGIEITESTLAESGQALVELQALHELGVRLAIDDFGTGYSSLARMRRFPVDLLKIDRSFVVDADRADGAAAIAAIVDLGHAFGAEVIAEGVDRPDMLAALRRTDCDHASGFLLARPAPLDALDLRPVDLRALER